MSGVKETTVRVPERELRDLRARAQREASERSRREAADHAHQAEARRREQAERQLDRERTRQERTERHVQTLDGELRAAEERLQRSLDEQREALRSTARDFTAALQEALARQERALRSEIARVADDVHRRQHRAAAAAARWIELADAEIELVATFERHDLFARGALAGLRARRDLAAVNRGDDLSEAATALAQDIWLQSRALRAHLTLAESAWQGARARAFAAVDGAERVLCQARRQDLRLDDQPAFEVDVDHWSDGVWGRLSAELGALREALETEGAPCTLADLERIAEDARGIEDRVEPMVVSAQDAVLASVLRHDLQESMLARLEALGYILEDSAWEGDDQRRALHQRLRNASGDELVVVVTPGTGAAGLQTAVQLNFQDRSPNAQVRRERLAAVRRAIREDVGGQEDGFREEPGFEGDVNAPAERFDLRKVRARARPTGKGA